jgi:hypothetical protein
VRKDYMGGSGALSRTFHTNRRISLDENLHQRAFDPIALDELDDSLSVKRYETKYLFSPELIHSVLSGLTDSYRVLRVNDHFLQDYETLYFDTSAFKFYLDHQNGKLNRYKVRFRQYPASKSRFIEIKFKNNKSQTEKWRKEITKTEYNRGIITDRETRFINAVFDHDPGNLSPRLAVAFSRLALIHKRERERVTIDLDLSYVKGCEERKFSNFAIAELKQETLSHNSIFSQIMRELHIPPMRFSKYCFGIYQFYPLLKYNRFKPRYMFLKKIRDDNITYEETESD